MLTRKVVDSNFLRSPDLTLYLSKSPSNQVVLTEFILMEQYKKNAPVTVRNSFERCSKFAAQVIILKRSPEILRLKTRSNGMAKRMIDQRQTAAFAPFCNVLNDPSKTSLIDRHIQLRGDESAAHMKLLLEDSQHVTSVFDRISTTFKADEIEEVRIRSPLRRTTQKKLLDTMVEESERLHLAAKIESQYWPATIGDALNSYAFRYALCLTLLYMRWIRDGKQRQRSVAKIRNDIVDAIPRLSQLTLVVSSPTISSFVEFTMKLDTYFNNSKHMLVD
jgi:hypothetical protein